MNQLHQSIAPNTEYELLEMRIEQERDAMTAMATERVCRGLPLSDPELLQKNALISGMFDQLAALKA